MALTKTTKTEWGIEVKDAYSKVENVILTAKDKITFHVRSYVSNDGVPFFTEKVFGCDYDINGENPIKQAYLHLKTLTEFSDAVDC